MDSLLQEARCPPRSFHWFDWDESQRCANRREASEGLSWAMFFGDGCQNAQQISPAVERGTAPFQYALTTRGGAECIAHVIQTLTDVDQEATVLSVDGVGAFDLISRVAILEGLRSIDGGGIQFSRSCLSFTALHPRTFGRTIRVWSTKSSKVRAENRAIRSCLPFSQSVSTEHWRPQESGCSHEHLLAFLDDIYIVCRPERVVPNFGTMRGSRYTRGRHRCGIAVKWSPRTLRFCKLQPRWTTPTPVWKGRPHDQTGRRDLGDPVGTRGFCAGTSPGQDRVTEFCWTASIPDL